MIAYTLAAGLQLLSVLLSFLTAIGAFGGYWYWRNLKNDWVLDESTTNRFDLPERGYISGLRVIHRGTTAKNLDTTDNIYPVQMSTVRLLGNGNVEIVNARARQLHAMDFWDRGVPDHRPAIVWTGWESSQEYFLPFGRFMGDPKYGLILDNFPAGVQFEETNTISTTNYTDALSKMDIYALMRKSPEGGLFSGGFMRKRQILNKDTASETKYGVKLPTVNKIRQIHLFSEPDISSGVQSTTIFTNVERIFLSIKSKEEYLIDNMHSYHLAYLMHDWAERYPETVVYGGLAAANNYLDTMIYERIMSQALPVGGAAVKRMITERDATMLERAARVYGWDADGVEQTCQMYLHSKGICLHGDIPLLMVGPLDDEDEFLDAYENRDVYIEVTEGASTGNWYVVLDELQKTYPSA